MSRTYHVYILASGRNGTLYTGVTGDLAQRMEQHRDGEGSKFTTKYGVTRLVHIEAFADVSAAIAREKAVRNGAGHGNWNSSNAAIRNGSTYMIGLTAEHAALGPRFRGDDNGGWRSARQHVGE